MIHQGKINFKSCPAMGKKRSNQVKVKALQLNEVKTQVENKQQDSRKNSIHFPCFEVRAVTLDA